MTNELSSTYEASLMAVRYNPTTGLPYRGMGVLLAVLRFEGGKESAQSAYNELAAALPADKYLLGNLRNVVTTSTNV